VELLRRKTCKWFAFAEGTTVFGSHVVASILSSPAPVGDTLPADMLLLPSDSAKFARQGERLESVLCAHLCSHRCFASEYGERRLRAKG
jgi:hypothetical protein